MKENTELTKENRLLTKETTVLKKEHTVFMKDKHSIDKENVIDQCGSEFSDWMTNSCRNFTSKNVHIFKIQTLPNIYR
jgi:hypothetical protein